MSARHPFSMVPHADFLARCADLEGDEIALFTIAFFLMLERRGPLDDDMGWLGRKAGISTRRANQIRAKLLDQGKWASRAGQLGDSAALAIIERANRRSATNSTNALARWDRAGQGQLDLPAATNEQTQPVKRRKSAKNDDAIALGSGAADAEMQSAGKNADKSQKKPRKIEEHVDLIGQESADFRQSAPENRMLDSHARATPELESEESISNDRDSRTRASAPPSAPPSLPVLLGIVSDASGYRPATPEQIDAALEYVKAWRDAGIDFERTIVPTISRIIAAAPDDPTSSLKRFDRHVRHAAALHRGTAAAAQHNGTAAAIPAQLCPDDADPRIEQIRADLLRRCGRRTYDGWLRPISFTLDGTELHALAPSNFMADWVQSHFAAQFQAEARRHGFTAVRISVAQPRPQPPP